MDLKEQVIREYLTQGGGFRKLAAKYGYQQNNHPASACLYATPVLISTLR